MYGLTKEQRKIARDKIDNTRFYLDNNFIEVDGKTIPLSTFYKNPVVNADRYVAEIQHRVWSLYHYARGRNLVNVFVTLTLPSEYHPTRTIKTKKGSKSVRNPKYIPEDSHDPKNGSLALSKMLKSIFDDRAYKSIEKEDRVYFRVTEPHKDGTPHLHISFFIPEDAVDRFVDSIRRKFPAPQSEIEVNVNNPVAYLMKYILKTFDDFRLGPDNITDLSLWYLYWGIGRFYTSRTLISLDVYRVLGGRFSLSELSWMYRDKEVTVYLNDQGKVYQVYQENNLIYQKKEYTFHDPRERPMGKLSLPEKPLAPIPVEVAGMNKRLFYRNGVIIEETRPLSSYKDLELYNYFREIEYDYEVNPQHYALVHNYLVDRGLLDDDLLRVNEFIFEEFDIFGFEKIEARRFPNSLTS